MVDKYTMKTIMVSFHAIPATHMALMSQLPSITSLCVLKFFKLMLIIFELQVVLVLIIWFLTWKNIKNYSNWYAPSPNLKTILLQAHLVQCLWLSADQNLQADYYHLVHSYIVVKCVTFDRKIKRSDLNVVISRSRFFTCSLSNGFLFHLSLYRFRTGQRSDAASYCEPTNSTKSQRIDRGIYPDKANISYSRCDS